MTQKTIITYIVSFLGYVILQAAFMNKLIIANMAFCFFYVGFIIYMPVNINNLTQLVLGFIIGLIIDVFGDTLGIHTISCTLIMFLRPFWIQISIGDISELTGFINLKGLNFYRLLIFSLPLLLVHHVTVFLLDSIGSALQFNIILKILTSTLFTFFVLTAIQLFSASTSKRS